MNERVHVLASLLAAGDRGARARVESAPGEGTTVRAAVAQHAGA